jgi:hypothetical protein
MGQWAGPGPEAARGKGVVTIVSVTMFSDLLERDWHRWGLPCRYD